MEDAHQMYPPDWSLYAFFILAPVIIFAVFYGGTKLMTYLENRRAERHEDITESSEGDDCD